MEELFDGENIDLTVNIGEDTTEIVQKTTTILNLKKDDDDERDYLLNEEVFTVEDKNSVNWTKFMSPVKDQGRLGSCVGFATAAMKEFQEQKEHMDEVKKGKKYKRKEDHYDLSEAWIYWHCKKIDPWPNTQGTSIRCAMKVLQKIGVPCEAGWEYDDLFKGEPKAWAHLVAKWGLIDSYYRVPDLESLKLALQNGPVVIGIGCFTEILSPNPTTGYVKYPANPDNLLGGHAICAVGYSDSTQQVKFKNSWSSGWGNKGYGSISYKYINDFMWDAWAAKDLSVTRRIIKEHDEILA